MKKLLFLLITTAFLGSCALEPEWNATPVINVFFAHDSVSWDSLGVQHIYAAKGDSAYGQLQTRSGYNHLTLLAVDYDTTLCAARIPIEEMSPNYVIPDTTGRYIRFIGLANYCYLDYYIIPLVADTVCKFTFTVTSDAKFDDPSLATRSIVKYVHCEKVSPSK